MKTHAPLACCALLLLVGCASPLQKDGRLRHRQFEVGLSSLDWLEIGYFTKPGDPRVPAAWRVQGNLCRELCL